MFKKIIPLCLVLMLMFSLTACGGETVPEVTDPPERVTEAESTCPTTEEPAPVAYFTQYGLDERLLDHSGEYTLTLLCGADPAKTTVSKVTVEAYDTIPSDETHQALEGYVWKIFSFKLHFFDENAQKYGINTWNYLWSDRYLAQSSDTKADTTGLFENGISYPIVWNGTEYRDGLLRIAESAGGWETDENGAYYLDIFVTVSVRVPDGYDSFVFGLESTDWEWPVGRNLHEVITDETLLFRFD